MSSSMIAMGVSGILVGGFLVTLAILNLVIGGVETYLGKPKLIILKATNKNSFAFCLRWNAAKEPAGIHRLRVKLFNPFGKPSQIELSKEFEPKDDSFVMEVDFGDAFANLMNAQGFEKSTMAVELLSDKDGVTFQFDYKSPKFKAECIAAEQTVEEFKKKYTVETVDSKSPIQIPDRSFIADVVPGKGAQIAIPTNPIFAAYFQGSGAGTADTAKPAVSAENYKMAKVWIEPGCIVCNACEDIYPEVFEVLADTCIVRPNPPLDDGLRIQEAAEACPVEVIKYTKAG
ncbi:MAG: ferredoxin [Bacteriovoracaceae bacterium]|nr:ferredoxin [Bacteriovoracaceae bacterium]